MEVRLGYRPLRVYEGFHASPARTRLLAGGFGTGKTMALSADAISRGLQIPGARILLSRATVPEVRDMLEPVFLDVLPNELYLASTVRRAGGHIESIQLPNGTIFLFRSIDDWRKYKSLNIALWYPDELSELDEETYNGMAARTRQVELTAEAKAMGYTHTIPEWFRGIAGATNPNGHDWIWKRFVDRPSPGTSYWVATSLDNPHLPEDYLRTLLDMPAAWVKRYVLASFDEFGGQIYPEWGYDTHMWRGKLEVDRAAPILMGFDAGTRHPTAALWVVQKGTSLIAVAEHKEAGWTVEDHAKAFRRIERPLPPVRWRVADPNSVHVRDRGTMMSLHRQYARQGFIFHDGPSSHQDRIPMLGTLVKHRRIFATVRTPMFFQQMADYRWEDLTPAMKRKLGTNEEYGPERPVKVNDDLVDCGQYLSSRLVKPIKPKARNLRSHETDWAAESAELTDQIKRQRRATRNRVQSAHDLAGVTV